MSTLNIHPLIHLAHAMPLRRHKTHRSREGVSRSENTLIYDY